MPPSHRILAVEPFRRGERLRLELEGIQEPLELPAAVCPPFAAGESIEAPALAKLREQGADHDVHEAALSLLSFRARSRGELRDRLLRKGFEAARVERCIARLVDAGVLNDASYAEAHVREAVRLKPKGRRRLAAELRRKGIGDTVSEPAITKVLAEEESPERELALRAAEDWARRRADAEIGCLCGAGDRQDVERARRRFWGYMSRRGFTPDAVRSALDRICA